MDLLSSRRCRVLLMAAGLAIGLLVAAGCYVGPVGVGAEWEVEGPPPALQEEVVVAAPGPEFVWIGGYWDWDVHVRSYVWRSGRWERPPHRGAVWVAPRYERRANRHYYHRGYWRR
jgi:WXXGXW repeat (2 copies)